VATRRVSVGDQGKTSGGLLTGQDKKPEIAASRPAQAGERGVDEGSKGVKISSRMGQKQAAWCRGSENALKGGSQPSRGGEREKTVAKSSRHNTGTDNGTTPVTPWGGGKSEEGSNLLEES